MRVAVSDFIISLMIVTLLMLIIIIIIIINAVLLHESLPTPECMD